MIRVIADDRFAERGLERTDQVVAQLAPIARPLARSESEPQTYSSRM